MAGVAACKSTQSSGEAVLHLMVGIDKQMMSVAPDPAMCELNYQTVLVQLLFLPYFFDSLTTTFCDVPSNFFEELCSREPRRGADTKKKCLILAK